MLQELKDVQTKGEKPRRWFQDDYFDLIVWYGKKKGIDGFQLCYDRTNNEHAFTWEKDKGFQHNRVDSGESTMGGGPKQTPILVADGVFPFDLLVKAFKEHSQGLEAGLVDLVLEKLAEYARKQKA